MWEELKMNTSKGTALIASHLFDGKGGRHVVISPGSRNAPLIIAFQKQKGIICHVIPDERSAGFVALGISKSRKELVALVCTSGTALLNYLPAIAEAQMHNIPLVVFSADRPSHWIGQGIGQSIDQVNALGNFVNHTVHLDDYHNEEGWWFANRKINECLNFACHSKKGPVHINMAFDEPLYNQIDMDLPRRALRILNIVEPFEKKGSFSPSLIKNWLGAKKKMVLCGCLDVNPVLNEQLNELSQKHGVIILHETTSNLSISNGIGSIDTVLAMVGEDPEFIPDVLITLGKHVISKRIKSFLNHEALTEHWDVNPYGEVIDTFQSLTRTINSEPEEFFGQLLNEPKGDNDSFQRKWLVADQLSRNAHREYIENAPFSDLKVYETVLGIIPTGFHVEMANSAVIRYAQLFEKGNWKSFWTNRGTSGIEGSTSTAIGHCMSTGVKTVLITGDISFFYDSNAFWNEALPANFRIVLVNNSGGGIFRYIPGPSSVDHFERFFESTHKLNAKGIAETFDIEYTSANCEEDLNTRLAELFELSGNRPKLLEIFTPRELNDKVLNDYFKFISSKRPH